jgi:TolA-binding protein
MSSHSLRFIYLTPLISLFLILSLQAQYNPENYFTYLENTFNEHDKSLQDLLIDELSHFLILFPEDENAGRVQYMLASVYREKNKEEEALAGYLKMIYLYPASAVIAANKDDLRSLIANERSFSDQQELLRGLIDQDYGNLPANEAFLKYLETMVALKKSGLRDRNLASCREFFRRFPDDGHHDQVMLWMADVYALSRDYDEANSTYAKFAVIFPGSHHLAYILYQQGQLYYEHLRQPEKAIEILTQVVNSYADSNLAGDAWFTMAEIKDKKNKDYSGAIADYRQVVDQYPNNEKAVEALWQIAEIQERNLKDYRAAVVSYNEIVEKYSANLRGIDALEEMADLYQSKLEDYLLTAQAYARIAELYPDYEEAPERLIDAGSVCEKRLDDYNQAITYYQMVIDNYPDSPESKEAAKKIEKAREKLADN